jgi:hypothetical protein
MKNVIFTAVLAVSVLISSAQPRFGLFGGPQVTSSKYIIKGKKQANSPKYGFQLGAGLKVPFENKLYFSPAAFYSLKGYDVKFSQRAFPPDTLAIDNNTRIHTFELATLFQYDFSAAPGHFFVRFGPSLDFQLLGKEKFNRSNRTAVNRDMVFSFTRYGRVGANMILQIGYETKKDLSFFAHYAHGIGSINNADGGPGIWHRAVSISAGKYFGKKK